MKSKADNLRALLAGPDILIAPACYDALSARLIERAGFDLSFMSGFAVSAARLGLPDTGLISYGEMLEQGAAPSALPTARAMLQQALREIAKLEEAVRQG